mmetsp:Transcript_2519/g.8215  ORF Transcript_2519/g.8215 Transcript_2519/m.8215 type:complete len:94 (-) Transcript_2519:1234-1515(-)
MEDRRGAGGCGTRRGRGREEVGSGGCGDKKRKGREERERGEAEEREKQRGIGSRENYHASTSFVRLQGILKSNMEIFRLIGQKTILKLFLPSP